MPDPHACARCARANRALFESPAGDLRCQGCLKFAGLAAEPDPLAPGPRRVVWLDLRALPCWDCPPGGLGPGGTRRCVPGACR